MKLPKLFKRKPVTIEQAETKPVVAEVVPEPLQQQFGGVVKVKPKQFVLDEQRKGGRVVKTMPPQLRHMKELSEKTDD